MPGLGLKFNTGDGEAFSPDWSPDGQKIVFIHSNQGSSNLAVVNIGTGETKTLPLKIINRRKHVHNANFKKITDPIWSPDGRNIAFAALTSGVETRLFLTGAQGGIVIAVTNEPKSTEHIQQFAPSWQPIFDINKDGVADVVDATNPKINTIKPFPLKVQPTKAMGDCLKEAPNNAPDKNHDGVIDTCEQQVATVIPVFAPVPVKKESCGCN